MSDTVSVFGGRAPADVELLWKHLKNLNTHTFTQILAAVLKAADGQNCSECVCRISESGLISEESLNRVLSGLFALLKEALRLPALRPEVFNEDLRALRIPEPFLAEVSSAVFGHRQTSVKDGGPSLAKMEEFRWRVDVAISTSSLARALQPSILMQIKLSDGQTHRFQVPVVKFQELRYNVSLILKEMNDIEKRSILRIQD